MHKRKLWSRQTQLRLNLSRQLKAVQTQVVHSENQSGDEEGIDQLVVVATSSLIGANHADPVV